MKLTTFPSQEALVQLEKAAFGYQHPNTVPAAVILEGYLSAEDCDDIIDRAMRLREPYKHPGCGAMTRELGHIVQLDSIRSIGHTMNEIYWNYDLDFDTMSWLQTYENASEYQMHMDMVPGQTRKLTAVALLTDENDYEGGALILHYHPNSFIVPKTRGTIVLFQPWILHQVNFVYSGTRQTINMGFWGPEFK